MPIGSDYRQSIILALQAQGADQVTLAADAIRELQGRMVVLNEEFAQDQVGPKSYIDQMRKLQDEIRKLSTLTGEYTELQDALRAMEQRSADEAAEAGKAKVKAHQDGVKAIRDEVQSIEDQRVAEIKAMGDRARRYAQDERMRQKEDADRHASLEQQIADEAALQAHLGQMEAKRRQEMQETAALSGRMTQEQGEAMRQRIDAYARAERAQEDADEKAIASMRKRGRVEAMMIQAERDGYTEVSTASLMASRNVGGYATKADAAVGATNRGSYAFLNLAHALQDAQYGFGAVLNNIPLVVQGMGGSAGLAGTIMIAGVAINTVMPHMEEFGKKIGVLRDPLRDATDGLEGMKEQLQALEDKPFKLDVDFASIRKLRAEIRETQRAIAEWEALKNKDSEAKGAAKDILGKAITESGGAQAVEDALVRIQKQQGTFGAGSELHGQIAWHQNAEDVANRGIKAMGGEDAAMAQPFVIARDYARSQKATLRNQLEEEGRAKIAQMMGLKWGEGSRKTLEDLISSPQGEAQLSAQGVDVLHLQAGVAGVAPGRIMEAKRKEIAEKQRKEEEQRANSDEAYNEQGKQEREALTRKIRAENNRKADADERLRDQGQKQIETAADKLRRENAQAQAQAARDEPAAEKAARIGGYAQDFQAAYGVDNRAAMDAGRQIDAMASKGANPGVAAQEVYEKMLRVVLKMQINQDIQNNFDSGALAQLQMLDAKASMQNAVIRGNVRTMGQLKQNQPHNNITFGF